MKPPSIVIDHFLSTKWSKKLFTINHYELQNGKCIVTQELSAYEEKAKLWADRIQQYKTSGQTCKQWCAENDIPLSTMGYWTRRLAKEDPASEPEQDLVFARLPSEQEAARKLLSEETAPVRIFVSDSIRIEISDSCRPELMESILGFLQCHA